MFRHWHQSAICPCRCSTRTPAHLHTCEPPVQSAAATSDAYKKPTARQTRRSNDFGAQFHRPQNRQNSLGDAPPMMMRCPRIRSSPLRRPLLLLPLLLLPILLTTLQVNVAANVLSLEFLNLNIGGSYKGPEFHTVSEHCAPEHEPETQPAPVPLPTPICSKPFQPPAPTPTPTPVPCHQPARPPPPTHCQLPWYVLPTN